MCVCVCVIQSSEYHKLTIVYFEWADADTNTYHTPIKILKNENALAAFNPGHLKSGQAPYSKGEVLKTSTHGRWWKWTTVWWLLRQRSTWLRLHWYWLLVICHLSFVICHLSFVICVFVYSCIYFFATTFMLKRIKHSNFFLIAATIKSQDQIFWRNTRKILALCKWYDFFQRTGTHWRSVRRRANGDVGEYQIVYVNFTPAG